jgi:ribosomal protein S18 acetylase RimI-like enzyme
MHMAIDNLNGDGFMPYVFRKAVPEDAPTCVQVRGQTRENSFSVEQLQAIGVTVETWREGIRDGTLPGYICLADGQMIGYCFGAPATGEIVVLALLPEHEHRGLGKKLLDMMVGDLKAAGHTRLFLGCSSDPKVRSYGFYRHEGWRSTGTVDAANDEVLELFVTPDTKTPY